jgi:hypothetical protein
LALARTLPAGTLLYSNAPEALWLHTGRPAYRLPRPYLASQQAPNPAYAAEVAQAAGRLQAGGVLVYFSAVRSPAGPTEAEVAQALGLTAAAHAADGTLYRARLAQEAP